MLAQDAKKVPPLSHFKPSDVALLVGFAVALLIFLARLLRPFIPTPIRFAAWLAGGALAAWFWPRCVGGK